MADWNQPTTSTAYATFLSTLVARDVDALRQLSGASAGASNIPDGAIRWNAGASRHEVYSSGVWGPLATTYQIAVQSAVNATNATNATLATNLGASGQDAAFFRNVSNLNAGVLGVARGGLGVANPSDRGLLIGRGAAAVDSIAPGSSGQVLRSNGAGSNPSFQQIVPAISGYTGGHAMYFMVAQNGFELVFNDVATWYSYGPTGGGADRVWTALDLVPTDTKAIRLRLQVRAISTNGGTARSDIRVHSAPTSATRSITDTARSVFHFRDHIADDGFQPLAYYTMTDMWLPVDNRQIHFYAQYTGATGDCRFALTGFMT